MTFHKSINGIGIVMMIIIVIGVIRAMRPTRKSGALSINLALNIVYVAVNVDPSN